jgi:ERCC4-type nuclease
MPPRVGVEVDFRERALLALVPGAERVSLPVGDVVIGGRIVLERKTVEDLSASIRDGRWRDQLARLRGAGDPAGGRPVRVAVIVEGDLPGDEDGEEGEGGDRGRERGGLLPGSSLRSALAGAFVRDGVPHFLTPSAEGTARLIADLVRRAERDEAPCEQPPLPAKGRLRLTKRGDSQSDPAVVAAAQLSVITGVSAAAARAAVAECTGIAGWLATWSGRAGELANVRIGGPGGRRIGPALARRMLAACGARLGDGDPSPSPANGMKPPPHENPAPRPEGGGARGTGPARARVHQPSQGLPP